VDKHKAWIKDIDVSLLQWVLHIPPPPPPPQKKKWSHWSRLTSIKRALLWPI
jgi:hypothetical protein